MLSQKTKDAIAKLGLENPAIAVKFCYERPSDAVRSEKKLPLCGFIKEAQLSDAPFYITAENEDCMGKLPLGMMDIPPLEGSGTAGVDYGVFATQAPNARLYHRAPRLTLGASPYVLFCRVDICEFDPDLVILLCDTDAADLVMRANSYFSGDLWESRDSYVMGCAFIFAYPYISGKLNHSTTGMHLGQNMTKPFPKGLQLITIPYQKLREITDALTEMDAVPIALRDDPESRAEMQRRIAHWGELDPDVKLGSTSKA